MRQVLTQIMALIKHNTATVKSAVKGERPGGAMAVFTAGSLTHSRKARGHFGNHAAKVQRVNEEGGQRFQALTGPISRESMGTKARTLGPARDASVSFVFYSRSKRK